MAKAGIQINIIGSLNAKALRSAQAELGQLAQKADRSSRTFGARLGSAGRAAAKFGKVAAIGIGGAAVAIGAGLTDALGEAREAARIGRLTDQVIKTTGGAAHVTAGHVASLAENLSNLTGIDDETVQAGENLLLTFTNVRNEVGEGNNVFDRATSAALDMATALGRDANQSAMMLGKALNDPVRGMNALRRSGVSFTEEQRDHVEAMVEAGDVLGGQKIILDEVGKEFGGAAAAAADPTQRLGVVVDNLKERIGTALLPVVSDAATWLGAHLPAALDTAGQFFDDHLKVPLRKVGAVISAFVRAVGEKGMLGALRDLSGPGKALAAVIATIGVAIWAATAPISLIVAGLAAVAVAVYAAYRRFPAFRAAVQAVVDFVREHWPQVRATVAGVLRKVGAVISAFVATAQAVWRTFGNNILSFVRRVWPNIKQVISGVLTVIRGIIKTVTSLIRGDWSGVWEGIKKIVTGAWNAIQGAVKAAVEALRLALGAALEGLGELFKAAWDGITNTAGNAVDAVFDFFKKLPGRIGDVVGGIGSAALDVGKTIVAKLAEGLSAVVGFAGDIAGAVANAIKSAINAIIDLLNDGIPNSLGWGPASIDLPDNPIPRLHTGGIVPGRRGEEFLALLEAGELVISASDARGVRDRGHAAPIGRARPDRQASYTFHVYEAQSPAAAADAIAWKLKVSGF